MNYLPSKELLSEVLGHKVWKVLGCNMGTLRYCIYPNKGDEPSEYIFTINLYELAHKCKEWATENKYTILTEDMHPNGYFAYVLSNKESIENYGYLCEHKVIKDIPHNKTEPEAIFRACQWILDNRN